MAERLKKTPAKQAAKRPSRSRKKAAAPKEPTEAQTGPKGHNAKVRKEIIINVIREVNALEARRKKITEEIAEIVNVKIKGDLGMKKADFAAALRLSRLENEDRQQFFDALQETFEALGQGKQLNWLDALEKVAPADQDETDGEAKNADPAATSAIGIGETASDTRVY